MFRLRYILFCVLLASALGARAAGTNSLIWHKAADRVDADIHSEALWPLLEQIAEAADLKVFVEPGAERSASAKFKDLPSGDALKMLLGDLNFALVPQTNAPSLLYVFRTTMQHATKQVAVAKPAKRIANELLLKVKPGTDIDALAKSLGAKVVGRLDKLGLYRLQFTDAAATDAALAQLQNNSDVEQVDYNYIYSAPTTTQLLSSASASPISLTLNPPGDSGRVIVGLIDTQVTSLDSSLQKFLLASLSAVGDTTDSGSDLTHGKAMAETILRALESTSGGSTSVQILPVNVYSSGDTTTSWDVAKGIQLAVDNGATILNLSLGGKSDSFILNSVIQQALAAGIPVLAAAGNDSTSTATYPAADSGVTAVTATQNGQLASYANYGSFVDMALPGSSMVYQGSQAYLEQGTSVSTAYASGIAAANKAASNATWSQILKSMQTSFAVPKQ